MLSEEDILTEVRDGSLFGVVVCDIRVPDNLKHRFKDFQPILKHTMISREDVGEHMKTYCEKNDILKQPRSALLGSYHATNHMVATDLLQWYLLEGFEVSNVTYVAQYLKRDCFSEFANRIMSMRRAADKDPALKTLAECFKLIGNSSYGKFLIDRSKFSDVQYYSQDDVDKISGLINGKFFRHLTYLEDVGMVEIESFKTYIKVDNPVLLGFTILERSKLILLRFVHYFLDKYLDKSDYCLLECDTDSMYLALSGDEIFPLVKPELREEFSKEYGQWFAKDYCDEHSLAFFAMQFAGLGWYVDDCDSCKQMQAYDLRQVGKFHLECKARGFVGLAPKSYYCKGDDGDKFSAKGVNKSVNNIRFEDFKEVLTSLNPKMVTNRGFKTSNGKMYTYRQKKSGLSYFYGKRKVGEDGIHTYPTDL